ncbi:transposase [Desulfomarina profundi]|uniref:Transposase n=1 Tax=Desulfomarina profundi TaxID=2772557 RepID=A0A8D5FT77_9BACT|nr:transposase [Desulfomarina profundi]BCL61445.1 transposase [Desulfomarina profundi]BCL61449.1 transposase [Desulfomarina profundi]
MIRYKSTRQLGLEGFSLPFGGKLNPENRWVKWSLAIPWDELASGYYKSMSSTQGRPGKDARLVIGAVIIKHKLNLSDEETVLQIQENPYLQYFVGLSSYKDEPPFTASLFVEIRKRMGRKVFLSFEETILSSIEKKRHRKTSKLPGSDDPENHGKMVVDATVAEQAIRYPTDISLLNEAREISEQLIDELYAISSLTKKPRTYRQQARKRYLAISKKRNPGGKLRRKATREQLQYLRRNFRHIEMLLDMIGGRSFPLHHNRQRQYWIIHHLYGQQYRMYKEKKRRCDDRIVSISQPHVRPIVRGKASHKVEFGSKLSVSMVDGIALVDHFGWDAFNESTDLITQIEAYKRRYGCFPEVVLADGIYGTRANRKYMKQNNIRFGGKPLGRPKRQTAGNAEQLKQEKLQRRQDALDRIPIEGKFGQGKNGYRLNYIRARTLKTSEAWINSIFLVMNLMVLLRFCCALLTGVSKKVQQDLFANLLAEALSVFVFQVMRWSTILVPNR